MSDSAPPRRIRAQGSPRDPLTMRFILDAPVQAGQGATFDTARADAPLAEALFAIHGVGKVQVTGETVMITRTDSRDWQALKAPIAAAIRQVLDSTDCPLGVATGPDPDSDAALLAKVTELLDRQANPSIAAHGGHVSAELVQNGIVHLRMSGGCQGCSASSQTLRNGIETMLRAAVPGIREIVDITDHAAGTAPFYSKTPGDSPLLVRPVPPGALVTEDGQTSIDPSYLAPRLGLDADQLRAGLAGGAVTVATETGTGPEHDRTRVTVRTTQRAWAAEILPDGSAREVPPPRTPSEPQRAPDPLPAKIRQFLDALPPEKLPVTYGGLARGLGMYAPGSVRRVTTALEATMREDTAAGRPFVAARVVGRGPARMPGKGFFQLARALGRDPGPNETEQAFHHRQLTESLAAE